MSISRPLAFLVSFDVQAVVPNYTTHRMGRNGTGRDRTWDMCADDGGGGCVPKEIHYKFLETRDSWLCWLEIQSTIVVHRKRRSCQSVTVASEYS